MFKEHEPELRERALLHLAEVLPEHANLHATIQRIGVSLAVSPDAVGERHPNLRPMLA